jgi:thiol-disulfide isomerase/thioredoxin
MTATPTPIATRFRNLIIVLVAVVLSVALFLGLRTGTNSNSLEAMAAIAVPLDVALKNGKPTLTEFYANWCSACKSMAKDMSELEKQYGDRINFVMLNVDNNKWLPEMLSYKVDGIPHFVFMDGQGEAIANTIGIQPRVIMAENLEAIVQGVELPHIQARGRISEVEAPVAADAKSSDPRGHGGQVVPAS